MAKTLPVDTDLDLCSITPPGGARQKLTAALGGLGGGTSPVAGAFTTLSSTSKATSGSATALYSAQTVAANGIPTPTRLNLTQAKNITGAALAAGAAAGVFGFSISLGTSFALISEAANSNTKTDVAMWEFELPPTYVAGSNINVLVNSNYTLGGGTVGTHTLAAAAYLSVDAGTQGSSLIATSAQTVPSSAGTQTFVITGTTLSPGDRLVLTLTLVLQDTGGSNITATINSVRLT